MAAFDLTATLTEVLNGIIELQRADFGTVQLLERRTGELKIVAQRGFKQSFLDHFRSVVSDESSACGQTLKRRARVIIEDVESDADFEPDRAIAASAGYRAMQSTPLFDRNEQALGVLSTHFCRPHRPSEHELRITDLYAHQAAQFIAIKQSERALLESEAKFRTLADGSPAFIWFLDPNAQSRYVNRPYLEFFGKTEEEVLGEGWQTLIHPDGALAYIAEVLAAVHAQRPLRCRGRVRRHDGEWRWTESRALPHFGENARYLGHVVHSLDITESLRSQQRLEKRSEEPLAALEEAERALAEAENAARAKDHFLAVLSHDLRTLLTPAIIIAKTLLTGRDIPPQVVNGLQTICRNIELQAHFIDDLLDVTRISRGKLELTSEPLDLHDALRGAIELTASGIRQKQQQLTVELSAQEYEVRGDFPRLQQVFCNLLTNGSKFTTQGGALRLSSRNEPGSIVVEVSDTGQGIEPNALARIFEPFCKEHRSNFREFAGLGLGLAISKATIETHRGNIHASSLGIGHGATFTIELPLIDERNAHFEI